MRVLLLDGRLEIEAALISLLEELGHEVYPCDDAATALHQVQVHQLVLVILARQDEEGMDFCRRLRTFPEGRACVVTAIADGADAAVLHRLGEAGVDDFLVGMDRPDLLRVQLAAAERRVRARAERFQAESELAKRARQQAIVAELGRQALEGISLQVLMSFAVEAAAQALGVEFCEVWEVLPEADELLLRAGIGWEPGLVGTMRVGRGMDSQAGYTLSSARSVVVSDLRSEERFTVCPLLAEHDVVSGVTVLIDTEPEPYGVLGVHTAEPRTFSSQDLDFLQSIANVLAEAIDRRHAEEALREGEARVRAILETTVDGIITADERGHITSFNTAAERIFGYTAEEVLGKNLKVLMPPPYRDEHDTYMRNYRETGRRKIIGIGREVTGRRKDGTTFPMDLAVSEVHLKGRRLFTGIVRDITERRRLEQEIIAISEQERRRIGQDLHDGLGQMLTGTGLISQNLARKLKANAMPGAEEVSEITDLIREADQFARALARGLVPVDLEANGLASALLRLASNAERLFSITCVFEEIDSPLVYDNAAATHLYRIAQEAVSNAVKHGRAGHVIVRLAAQDHQVRLEVQDDGVGFPDVLGEDRGMGVRIMHYRARIIGGTLEITRLPEAGTIVTCTLPDRSPSPKGRVSQRRRATS